MKALLFDRLPSEFLSVFTALEKALAARAELIRLRGEAQAGEPDAIRAAEQAVEVLEGAEVALSLGTDENFRQLTEARDQARSRVDQAQSAIETIRRRQRGISAKMVEANAGLEAAQAAWSAANFRGEVIARYRRYRAAAAASFVQALRLGWAIEQAYPRSLRSVLSELKIRDFGPSPGRPSPCLIDGDRAWLDEADPSGIDLRQFDGGDPELAALHALLQPLGRAEMAASNAVTSIARERAQQPPPPYQRKPLGRSAADLENERVQKMTQEEYRAHMAAKANAERIYPAPGRVTFSQGNAGNAVRG
jgi:hypothetical protein